VSFASLYELWPDPSKDDDDPTRWLWSATIITTDAHGPVGEIHDRTPLILPSHRIDAWLDPTLTDTAAVKKLLTGITVPALGTSGPSPPQVTGSTSIIQAGPTPRRQRRPVAAARPDGMNGTTSGSCRESSFSTEQQPR